MLTFVEFTFYRQGSFCCFVYRRRKNHLEVRGLDLPTPAFTLTCSVILDESHHCCGPGSQPRRKRGRAQDPTCWPHSCAAPSAGVPAPHTSLLTALIPSLPTSLLFEPQFYTQLAMLTLWIFEALLFSCSCFYPVTVFIAVHWSMN